MNTFQVIKTLDALLASLDDDSYLMQSLGLLTRVREDVIKASISVFAEEGPASEERAREARAVMAQALVELKTVAPGRLFVEAGKLKDILVDLGSLYAPEASNMTVESVQLTEQFTTRYEKYLMDYGYPETIEMLIAAAELHIAMKVLKSLLYVIRRTYK